MPARFFGAVTAYLNAQERVITGEEVAEHIEMGGREAREKLAMKLPKFGAPQVAKPARRTDSLISEVCTPIPSIALTRACCASWHMRTECQSLRFKKL